MINRKTRFTVAVLALSFLSACSALTSNKTGKWLKCDFIEKELSRSMTAETFYIKKGPICSPVDSPDKIASGTYFSDKACTEDFEFAAQSFFEYCKNNLLDDDRSKFYIGNPNAWKDLDQKASFKETPWRLSQGAKIDVAVIDQTKHPRPFVKGVQYRKEGSCSLEMTIIKNRVGEKNLKPLLYIHGGGWKGRGPGAVISIEGTAPNLTNHGWIIFAPYYRLIENHDGPTACRNKTGKDMLSDLEAAMKWVYDHGSNYGMDSKFGMGKGEEKLSLAGSSAGGHLAAYLASNFPDQIKRALLMYPATDFKFFIEQSRPGGMYESTFNMVKPLVVSFVNQEGVTKVTDLSTDQKMVQIDSFPDIINPSPSKFPKFYMVQGSADTIAPKQMTTRMCQALDPKESPTAAPYKSCADQKSCSLSRNCGKQGKLRIVGLAHHSLELKCFNEELGKFVMEHFKIPSICAPGSKEGEAEIREILTEVYSTFFK